MIQLRCPYCDAETELPEAPPGGIAVCPSCDHSVALAGVGRSLGGPGQPVRLGARAGRARHTSPSDVSLRISGPIALGIAVVFYAAVVYPLSDTYFGQLFGARGWVPYVITFLSAWAFVMLAFKYRTLSAQERALEFDLLPAEIAESVTPENSPAFASYLRNLPQGADGNFLIERVRGALQYFGARPTVQEVVDQLRTQADADTEAVESSYTMLRVFIWAIPILGFIGTVMGIGSAVGGFSEAVGAASDLGLLKNSIGSVTSGLGVAFDTTLLALVMSVVIMFPTSSLQKAEEGFLAAVEAYCNEHLVRRLDDRRSETASGAPLLERQLEVMKRLTDSVEDLEQRLSKIEATGRRGPRSEV